MARRWLLGLSLLAACGAPPARVELPAAKPPTPEVAAARVDPARVVPIAREDVLMKVGGRDLPGTVVRPAAGGRWPAVLLLAGSGPTDRDWNSPLLPGKNGAGRQLAEALAAHGAVVLRFDKALSGKNPGPPAGTLDLDTYVEEARAALTHLRNRPEVDGAHVFVAGHSEGGLHAIRTVLAEGGHVAGLLLLSTPGESLEDVLLRQIRAGLRDGARLPPATIATELDKLRRVLDAFVRGEAMDPADASDLPQIQQLVGGLARGSAAALARSLLAFDPATAASRVNVPVLVFNGLKDVQVDPQLDAGKLEHARHLAGREVTVFLAPDADHLLQHEARPLAALLADRAAVQAGYNAPGRVVDAGALAAILGWLHRQGEVVGAGNRAP